MVLDGHLDRFRSGEQVHWADHVWQNVYGWVTKIEQMPMCHLTYDTGISNVGIDAGFAEKAYTIKIVSSDPNVSVIETYHSPIGSSTSQQERVRQLVEKAAEKFGRLARDATQAGRGPMARASTGPPNLAFTRAHTELLEMVSPNASELELRASGRAVHALSFPVCQAFWKGVPLGDEIAWFTKYGAEPLAWASALLAFRRKQLSYPSSIVGHCATQSQGSSEEPRARRAIENERMRYKFTIMDVSNPLRAELASAPGTLPSISVSTVQHASSRATNTQSDQASLS